MPGVTVTVPATSANLGSGYDSFGLALGLYNTVSAELSVSGSWDVRVVGEGERDPALATDNRVVTGMVRLFAEAGRPDEAAHVFCRNEVPIGCGLGSSSAALVSGLVAANELIGRPFGHAELFRMAAELEGHPDNVAAALAGGFTLCWTEGSPAFARIEPAGGLAAICVVSDAPLSTAMARELLPASVPHGDAAFNVGRAGLLSAGIALGRAELIGPGMHDRLHQPYRMAAVPDLESVTQALTVAGVDGAALSGSGPTVIGLVSGVDDESAMVRALEIAARAEELLANMPSRRRHFVVPVDRAGARLTG